MNNIQATIIAIGEYKSGTSKLGKDWETQQIIVETSGQYPKKIAFTTFGEVAKSARLLPIGQVLDIKYDVESREYNGKWYTDAKMINFTPIGKGSNEIKEEPFMPPSNDNSDTLPF